MRTEDLTSALRDLADDQPFTPNPATAWAAGRRRGVRRRAAVAGTAVALGGVLAAGGQLSFLSPDDALTGPTDSFAQDAAPPDLTTPAARRDHLQALPHRFAEPPEGANAAGDEISEIPGSDIATRTLVYTRGSGRDRVGFALELIVNSGPADAASAGARYPYSRPLTVRGHPAVLVRTAEPGAVGLTFVEWNETPDLKIRATLSGPLGDLALEDELIRLAMNVVS